MKRLLLVVAVTVAALSLGLAEGGKVRGVEVDGAAELHPDGLRVPAEVPVAVGTATELALEGTFTGELDLTLGEPGVPGTVIAHFGPRSSLLGPDLQPLGDDPAFPFIPGRHTLHVRCSGTLTVEMDGSVRASLPAPPTCPPRPFSLRSTDPMVLHGLELDGEPVSVSQSAVSWLAALVAAGLVAGLLLVVPPEALWLLVLTPLVALAPQLGLDPRAAWAGVYAAVAFDGARRVSGRARLVAGGAAALAVVAAAVLVALPLFGPVRGPAPDSPLATQAAKVLIDFHAAQAKVDAVVTRVRADVSARPPGRPLVIALGSSSSGGGQQGAFWPQVLQELRPDLYVVSAAEGGATSWHMRKVVERLPVKPDLCVSYLGHNDTLASFPGLSIAELERGLEPRTASFVPPVTRDEARENYAAMLQGCGRLLAMQEYARGREPTLASYAALLREVPGVIWADGGAVLAGAPSALTMVDDVHPTPSGQRLLGAFVAERVAELLPPP